MFVRRIFISLVFLLFAYVISFYSPPLSILSGYSAKYVCSSIFVANFTEQTLYDEDLNFSILKYATITIDYDELSVTSSIFGFAKRKAIFRQGLGATLINELTEEQIRAQKFDLFTPSVTNRDNIPWPMGNKIDNNDFPSNINQVTLQNAVNAMFIEKDPTKPIRTRAIVVLYDGKLVAEQYAPGFSKDSRFLGWSMTKSIISALIGILVKDQKIDISKSAPVPEWNQLLNDARQSITTKHLLQQMSGLNFVEDYYSRSDVTQMLFDQGDMAAFTASHQLKHQPGTECYYTSGNTNLLSRIIRHTVGENEYHSFPYRRLFSKLGMNSMLMEVDASGTFVGSSYSWATARDWARFGLLYLNKGFYNNERILSEDWIQQSVTLAGSNVFGEYGYQFWLNTGRDNNSSARKLRDVPTDMFFANGFDGQSVFVIPSKKLVVVRLGLTKTPGDKYGANNFLKNIISSID